MFQNRVSLFPPTPIAPAIDTSLLAAAMGTRRTSNPTMAVQLADIYEAAAKRSIEEYEMDKLFNADYYGDHI